MKYRTRTIYTPEQKAQMRLRVLKQGVYQKFSIAQFSNKTNNRGLIFVREINGS